MDTRSIAVRVREGARSAGPPIVVLAVALLLWLVLARVFADRHVVPSPAAVFRQVALDRAAETANAATTLREALIGYVWGNAAAIALAVLFVEFPWVEQCLLRVAVAGYCIPLVAIGPILVVVLPGDAPKEALAALCVFFSTLLSAILGLRSTNAVSVDLVRSMGGGRWKTFWSLRIPSALPGLFAGLRIAAPAALLGAVVGEYFGASRGLGVALVQAQSSFEVARSWAIALIMAALAGALYGLTSAAARLLTPWVGQDVVIGAGAAGSRGPTALRTRLASGAMFLLLATALGLGLWYGLLRAFHLDNYFAKTPADVWNYLVSAPGAADNRAEIASALRVTLVDAGVGYLVGTGAAVVGAVAMEAFPLAERGFVPLAILLRSVPMIALAPLISLIFGRGLLGVTVVVAAVTFFPTLIYVSSGLRSAPRVAAEVVLSLGGSRLDAVRKVRILYALPSLFTSARNALPAALGGALLAEWISTGQGAGNLLVVAYSGSQFGTLWAGSVVLIAASVACYAAIGLLEDLMLNRFGARSQR